MPPLQPSLAARQCGWDRLSHSDTAGSGVQQPAAQNEQVGTNPQYPPLPVGRLLVGCVLVLAGFCPINLELRTVPGQSGKKKHRGAFGLFVCVRARVGVAAPVSTTRSRKGAAPKKSERTTPQPSKKKEEPSKAEDERAPPARAKRRALGQQKDPRWLLSCNHSGESTRRNQ